MIRTVIASLLAVPLLVGPAIAQAPPRSAPPAGAPSVERPDPKACAPGERATVGSREMPPAPQPPQTGNPDQNLADKLARTDGVICPPGNIDPAIDRPAPGGGETPVIPPPGSPGGDPTVRPK